MESECYLSKGDTMASSPSGVHMASILLLSRSHHVASTHGPMCLITLQCVMYVVASEKEPGRARLSNECREGEMYVGGQFAISAPPNINPNYLKVPNLKV